MKERKKERKKEERGKKLFATAGKLRERPIDRWRSNGERERERGREITVCPN
jgi:hypothetical protein